MVTSSWFLSALEARNNVQKDIAVHNEIYAIESEILQAVVRGDYETTVTTSPMTNPTVGVASVFTVSATTNALTITAHGLQTGDVITVSSSAQLPPPLLALCPYYVIRIDANTIRLASSRSNALAGIPIEIDISLGVTQVNITNVGSRYLTTPGVVASGGGATTSATLRAVLQSHGSLYAVEVLDGGMGYTDVPTATVQPVGSGATAGSCTFSLVSAVVNNGGSGYNAGDLLYVSGGVGTQAVARVETVSGGAILTVSVSVVGNYTTLPTLTGVTTTSSGTGVNATLNLSMGIQTIAVATPGINYLETPLVSIGGGGGSGARATVVLSTGTVGSIVVTNRGTGFTGQPTVDILSGSGAVVVPQLKPTTVGSIAVTSSGTYQEPPPVLINSPGIGASVGIVYMTVVAVSITNGGLGYMVGDHVQISGGVGIASAILQVTAVNASGQITSSVLLGGGSYSTMPSITSNSLVGGTGVGAITTITMGVGSCTVGSPGISYPVPPLVVFTGGGGFNTTAISTISGGGVTSIIITHPGEGYTSIPTVTLTTGENALATAVLFGTSVSEIIIDDPGSGYITPPDIVIQGGGGIGATAHAEISAGEITTIILDNPGSGYTGSPQVIVEGNAQVYALLVPSAISSITIDDPGNDYVARPNITIPGANAYALLAATEIATVYVSNGGSAYTSNPILTWNPGAHQIGDYSIPSVRTTRGFSLEQINVVAPGGGYDTIPSIQIAAPSTGGTQAQATAVISSGSGTLTLQRYSTAQDYYLVYKNQTPSSSLLSRPYTDRMDAVVKYFTDLGYTIVREANPVSHNTFQWHVLW